MNLDRIDWFLARGSGFTAFLLLSAATVAGLALSMRWATTRWPGVLTNDLHRRMTTLALWMTGLHVLMLLVDSKSGVGLAGALVPFASSYRPLATTLGGLALYTLLTVLVSTRYRTQIGYRRWRQIHGLAFATYAAALLHGLLAGTDAGTPLSIFVYLTSATLVGGLILIRLMAPRGLQVSPEPAAATAAAAHAPSGPTGTPPLPPLPPRSTGPRRLF